MKELIETKKDLEWVDCQNNTVEVYFTDELPDVNLCTASYSFVFKDGKFLQTELRKGERPERRLDIPGGHIEEGELPDQTAIRETFEETGVRINNAKLISCVKITAHMPKPDITFKYLYPVTYMLFYLCDYISEEEFLANDEVCGRVWLKPEEFENSLWIKENSILFNKVLEYIKELK